MEELFTQGVENRWDLVRLYRSVSLPFTLVCKYKFNLRKPKKKSATF